MKLVKYSKWIYCAVCILFIALGVCLTVYPSISVTVMSYIFGAVALAFGIIKIVGYFADDLYGLVFQFDLALGIFSAVLGVLFIVRPKWLMTALPLAFGVFVLINSLLRAERSRRQEIRPEEMVAGAAVLAHRRRRGSCAHI